jgi:hypothetical protein
LLPVGFTQNVTRRFHKQEATHQFPKLQTRFSSETEVIANRPATFRVTTVARQPFQLPLCVCDPNEKQRHFLMKL